MRRLRSWLAESSWFGGSAVALATATVALVVLVHRASPRTLVSAHGLLHAAIAERFRLGIGSGFPPENPFFAGTPLPYYWFFQYVAAKLAAVLGTDPLHAFEILIVAAAAVAVFGAFAIGRAVHGARGAGMATVWLLLAGALPQGVLVLAARLPSWGIARDDLQYLWGSVHPIAREMRVLDEFSMYGPLVTFFLNVTARPLAIAGLVLVVLALRRFLETSSHARGLQLALAVALCAVFGSLVALAVAGALSVGLVLLPAQRSKALPAIACLLVGLAAASFSFHHLLGRTPLAFHDARDVVRQLGRMAESGWLVALLAAVGLRAATGEARNLLALLVLAAVVLAIGCAAIALPTGNEDNLWHAALVMLAVPAAGCVRARWGKLALLAFVPTFVVQVGAFLARPPIDVGFEHGRIVRADPTSPEARLYRWIETSTDPDAVFVTDPRPPIRAAGGNTAELPALTGRAIFTERAGHYLVAPNADAAARVRIAEALVDGQTLAEEDAARLATLGRDVYVVRENAADGDALFRSGPISVYRWKP